ncbi:MAG: uracil-DNA glycosylase family protein [Chromatiales bacterium]
MDPVEAIQTHQSELRQCRRCPDMIRPVVVGEPAVSPVMLIGQAPGEKEGPAGRPFAWTAGRTLFQWFAGIGLEEAAFRRRVYMAAVCRCYPGKAPKGGDRVPSRTEIRSCAPWMRAEMRILRPRLILPVGRLAAARFLSFGRLTDVIGEAHRAPDLCGRAVDVIPLPHPSGASPWHRVEPGKALLERALVLIGEHPAWRAILD